MSSNREVQNPAILNTISDRVIRDYYTAAIKSEVILDTLITPVVEDLLNIALGRDGENKLHYVTKEFPLMTKLLAKEDTETEVKTKEDDRSVKADYLLCDDKYVYVVELKTTSGSFDYKQFNKYKAFCEECCFSKLLDCFADVVAKAYSVNNDGEGNSFEKLEGLYNSILSNERWKKASGDTHNRLLGKKDIKELRERKNYTSTKKYMTQVAEIIDAREYFYDSNNKPRDFIIERGEKHSSDIKCIYLLPISKQYGNMHNAMHKKDANYINEGNKEDYSNGPLMYIGLDDLLDKITKEGYLESEDKAFRKKEYFEWLVKGVLKPIFGKSE